MKPTVLVIGTLDTKGEELGYLRDEIVRRGCQCLVMDVGVLGEPAFKADIQREEVIRRGGGNLEELAEAAAKGSTRGSAVDIVTHGGKEIAKELLAKQAFDGVISIGGGTGTAVGTAIMRGLPLGVPKLQVSTLPGSPRMNMACFIGDKDIMMLNSIVDIVGLNSITRIVLQEAAGAIAGMARDKVNLADRKRCVAITCLGVTTPMVMKVRQLLIERGREVVVLHRRTQVLEALVAEDMVEAVLDLTPNELIDDVVYPGTSPDPSASGRLKQAREAGLPMIIAPGALDMILVPAPVSDIPEQLKTRKYRIHTPHMTLVRTTEAELRALGRFIGGTVKQATGPAGVVVPLAGLSAPDCEGSDFHDAGAIASFLKELRAVAGKAEIREIRAHINSDEFVQAVIEMFDRMMQKT